MVRGRQRKAWLRELLNEAMEKEGRARNWAKNDCFVYEGKGAVAQGKRAVAHSGLGVALALGQEGKVLELGKASAEDGDGGAKEVGSRRLLQALETIEARVKRAGKPDEAS